MEVDDEEIMEAIMDTSEDCASSTMGQVVGVTTGPAGPAKDPYDEAAAAAAAPSHANSAVVVRILFQYLEGCDRAALALAKEVLKDCKRKHQNKDSKFATLAEAVNERVRNAVGEAHWAQACQIQSQLVFNQRKKRVKMALHPQHGRKHPLSPNQDKDGAADSGQVRTRQGLAKVRHALRDTEISVPRRGQIRVKKRKKSRSPSAESGCGGEGSTGNSNSDSSCTSTSSITMSGNEKSCPSTSSTAPSTSSTNRSSSENYTTPQESSSCTSSD